MTLARVMHDLLIMNVAQAVLKQYYGSKYHLKTPRKAQKAASYNKLEYNTIQNELTLCILHHKCQPSMCKWRAILLTRCCRWYHRQEVANNQSRSVDLLA